jgi:hypothetical protein
MEITLKFDLTEVNTLLGILGETPLPYKVSEPLIRKIREQAAPQVQTLPESTTPPVAN